MQLLQHNGAGIARAIAKEFPEAEDVDNNTTKGNKAKLGSYSAAYTKHGFIFNLYGQYFYGYGKNINYLALKDSLQRMVEFLQEARIGSVKIGIPKLGCGLAGGDWHAVENIIQETIGDFDVTVYTLEG